MIKNNYKWVVATMIIATTLLTMPIIADAARAGRIGGERVGDRSISSDRNFQDDNRVSRSDVADRASNVDRVGNGKYTYKGQNYNYYHNGQYYNYYNGGNYYRYYNNGGYYNYLASGIFYLYLVNGVYCNVLTNSGECANS